MEARKYPKCRTASSHHVL